MSLFEIITLGQGSPSHGAYRPVATVEEEEEENDDDKVETARLADMFVSEPQARDNGKDDDDGDANYDYNYNFNNPKRRIYYGLMIIAIAAFVSVQHVVTNHSPDDNDASKVAATTTTTTTHPLPDWEQDGNGMAEHSSKSVSTMTHDGSVIFTDTDPTTMIATSAMTSSAAATVFTTTTTSSTSTAATSTSTTTSEDDTTTFVAITTTTSEQVSTGTTTPATAAKTNKENMVATSTLDTNETIATAQSTTSATEMSSVPTTATAELITTTTQSITQTATPPASTDESTTSETTIAEEATTDAQSTTQSTITTITTITTTTTETATFSTTTTAATTQMTTAATTALSIQERYEYMREPDDHDIEFLRQPKGTPSGWWPNRAWVRTCATKVRDNLTPFATWPEWEDYRLGDCVKICRGCPTQRGHDALANWTLAGEYYDLACPPHGFLYQKRGNETLLDELVDARQGTPGFVKPNPEAVVVHLRLGDKVEWAKADVFTILQNAANPYDKSFQGMHALKSVYEFLTDIVSSEATQVVIRGGSQLPNLYVKSKTYAYCIQEAVEMAGYNVTMNLDEGNADRDFYFLSHARKIIVTLGGYSRFVGHAVLRRGGIVYGRLFR